MPTSCGKNVCRLPEAHGQAVDLGVLLGIAAGIAADDDRAAALKGVAGNTDDGGGKLYLIQVLAADKGALANGFHAVGRDDHVHGGVAGEGFGLHQLQCGRQRQHVLVVADGQAYVAVTPLLLSAVMVAVPLPVPVTRPA